MCINALIIMEHRFDSPKSPFAKLCDEFAGSQGSYELRASISNLGDNIERVYHNMHTWSCNSDCCPLGDSLMTATGCWDFEVLPRVLDHLAKHCPDMLEAVPSDTEVAVSIVRLAEPSVAAHFGWHWREVMGAVA